MENIFKVKCSECGNEINYIDSYTIQIPIKIEVKKNLCESCYTRIISCLVRKAEKLYLRKTQLLSLDINTEEVDQQLVKAINDVNSVCESHLANN